VKLRNVRITTMVASTPALVNVGETATVSDDVRRDQELQSEQDRPADVLPVAAKSVRPVAPLEQHKRGREHDANDDDGHSKHVDRLADRLDGVPETCRLPCRASTPRTCRRGCRFARCARRDRA
jgi:hypothetical protein